MSPETRTTTNCPACQGLVSLAADACPHCGHPMDEPALTAAERAAEEAAPPPRDRVWRVAHRGLLGHWALAIGLGGAALALAAGPLFGGGAPAETPADPAAEAAPSAAPSGGAGSALRKGGAALLGLGALAALGAIAVARLGTRYELSRDGWVRERRGLVAKRTAELHVSDIRLVNVRQSVWQRILHIGDLDISSAGVDGVEITFAGLPHPEDAKAAILDAEARDRRASPRNDAD